jgi:Cd2+/Zn2+-exporting ATPase
MVAALSTAARSGVLIKGGAVLERLAGVRAVAFDKTGTLTTGRVEVTTVQPVHGTAEELLRLAAALEVRSEHPIARAIVLHATTQSLALSESHDVQALPGFGATGRVHDALIHVGNHRLFERDNLCTPALHAVVAAVEATGASAVCVSRDGAPLGVIGLSDTLRPEAAAAVAALRPIGIDSVVVLTGDSRTAADVVHRGTQMDQVHADLLPEDKLAIIEALRREHRSVLMVGDGLNDTPALAAADVSLAMGAGAGAALETADATLLRDDLQRIPWLLRLGRDTVATIHTNVALALGLKALFVALTFLGWSTLWLAVLADTGASMLVVANSLRLLRHVPGSARVR